LTSPISAEAVLKEHTVVFSAQIGKKNFTGCLSFLAVIILPQMDVQQATVKDAPAHHFH